MLFVLFSCQSATSGQRCWRPAGGPLAARPAGLAARWRPRRDLAALATLAARAVDPGGFRPFRPFAPHRCNSLLKSRFLRIAIATEVGPSGPTPYKRLVIWRILGIATAIVMFMTHVAESIRVQRKPNPL